MFIRSQDKTTLINLTTSNEVYANENKVFSRDRQSILLGEYTTEEKAIKSIDMICSFADGIHYEQVVPEQCGNICGVIFNMPLDEEIR